MFFLSRAQLKLEQYHKALQTSSLVSSSTTNKSFKYTKHKNFLDQLLEITSTFIDSITPEDLVYVAISIYEQIFAKNQKSERPSNLVQVQSNTVNGEDNEVITYPNPDKMNGLARNVFDVIQQYILFSFSLIVQKQNNEDNKPSPIEWIKANQAIFELLKECFSYYYPLYKTHYNYGYNYSVRTSETKADHVRPKLIPGVILNMDKARIKNLNILGVALLDIRINETRQQIIEEMESDNITDKFVDCTSFCKRTQFWAGYYLVLAKCPSEILWKELDVICSFQSPTILGKLGLLNSPDDCIKVLDYLLRKKDIGKYMSKR